MSEDDAEKSHEPSQRKLDEARRKGDLPRSADLVSGAALTGFLIAVLALGAGAVQRFGTAGAAFLDGSAARWSSLARVRGPGVPEVDPWAFVGEAVLAFGLLLAVPWVLVLATVLATGGLSFAPDKLMPRLSRISPLAAASQRFGRNGLIDFVKNLAKAGLMIAALWFFGRGQSEAILGAFSLAPLMAAARIAALAVAALKVIVPIALLMGVADYLLQRFRFTARHRMTRQEVMDEYKQSEGDPHVKGQRRQRGREIAMNRMIADVATADVVIVNPTHYAVALRWTRKSGRPPVCVAKGTDTVAARIREAAAAAGVPVRSDPPTARALHAAVDVGREIRPEHFAAVAAAIRFAETMRKRARERRGT